MGELRSYMAWAGDPQDGAALVFAHSAAEAKRLAWPTLQGWMTTDAFTDVRVRWLRTGCLHLRKQDGPHVVDAPLSCADCGMWWEEPLVDGLCEGCRENSHEFEMEMTIDRVSLSVEVRHD